MISCDWSSDVCSSDLLAGDAEGVPYALGEQRVGEDPAAVARLQVALHA